MFYNRFPLYNYNEAKVIKIKILICIVIGYFCTATIALAQSHFAGTYLQAGIGYGVVNQNATQTVTLGSTVVGNASLGNLKTVVGSIGLGHYWDVNSDFVLGLGVDFSPGASASSSFTVTSPVGLPPSSGSTQFKNGRNFYITPGYLLSSDQLIYAKLGYAQMTGVASSAALTASDTLSGYSIGLGYKQIFANHFYGFAEWKYVSFQSVSTSASAPCLGYTCVIHSAGQPSGNDAIIGVGYSF